MTRLKPLPRQRYTRSLQSQLIGAAREYAGGSLHSALELMCREAERQIPLKVDRAVARRSIHGVTEPVDEAAAAHLAYQLTGALVASEEVIEHPASARAWRQVEIVAGRGVRVTDYEFENELRVGVVAAGDVGAETSLWLPTHTYLSVCSLLEIDELGTVQPGWLRGLRLWCLLPVAGDHHYLPRLSDYDLGDDVISHNDRVRPLLLDAIAERRIHW